MDEKRELTEKQEKMLEFITEYIEQYNLPPTVREICVGVGINSTSTVHNNLRALEEMGYIIYKKSARRSIMLKSQVASKDTASVFVPLLGNVAAGIPIQANESVQSIFALPQEMLHGANSGEVFMLKIRGESMIDIGILDGDMIIVHKNLRVDNGDVAVVRINDEDVTCKRFFNEKGRIRLQPENSTMQPIFVGQDDTLTIVGKVIGVMRCM